MFESLFNFVFYWVREIINLFLNIVPIGWALYLINFFSPNNLLENANGWVMILVGFMLTVVIGGLIIKKIEQMFSNDNLVGILGRGNNNTKEQVRGYGVVLLFFQWLIGIIKTRELIDKLFAGRNIHAIIFSMLFIVFLFVFSFNGIRTASDLISVGIQKEQNKEENKINIDELSEEEKEALRQLIISVMTAADKTTQENYEDNKKEENVIEQLHKDMQYFSRLIINILATLQQGNKIETPVLIESQVKQKQNESEDKPLSQTNLDDLLTQKRIVQKFFLGITMNYDKPVSNEITYYLSGLPLEPITYSKFTNFIYYTFLLLVVIVFWLIVIAISPILDIFTILFTKREYEHVDYIGMFIRMLIAILVFMWLFNVYTI